MRHVVISLILCAAIVCSGCSYLLTKRAPDDYDPRRASQRPLCSTSIIPPVGDIVLANLGILLTAESMSSESGIAATGGLAMVGLGTAGAIFGFENSAQCRRQTRTFRHGVGPDSVVPSLPPDHDSKQHASDESTPSDSESRQKSAPSTTSSESGFSPESLFAGQLQRVDRYLSLTLSLTDIGEGIYGDWKETPPHWGTSATLEGMVEINLPANLSVAASVGRGTASFTEPDIRIPRYRFGGQVMWYPFGSFTHGLQVGGYGHHSRVYEAEEIDQIPAYVQGEVDPGWLASSYKLAPFIGYKVASLKGFTFNIQVGVGARLLLANPEDDAIGIRGNTSKIQPSGFGNLNVGWSF